MWRLDMSRYAELPSPNHFRSDATHAERGEPQRVIQKMTPEKRTSKKKNREIEELEFMRLLCAPETFLDHFRDPS